MDEVDVKEIYSMLHAPNEFVVSSMQAKEPNSKRKAMQKKQKQWKNEDRTFFSIFISEKKVARHVLTVKNCERNLW